MSTLHIQIDHADTSGFHLQVDTHIELAGVTALFGASGSGKTTLLDVIAGLRRDVENASVRAGNESWQEGRESIPAARRLIGYVFQDARLFPHLTVAGNLAYAEKRAPAGGFSRGQITNWLGIDTLLHRQPDTLSAGQQQRVAIARALLRSPQLLLMDEPLANLDRAAATEVLERLSLIARETRIPMIYVSHQIEEVSAIADRILLINNGRIDAQGSLLDMASRLDSRLADDEAAAAILRADVGRSDPEYGLCELLIDSRSLWVSGEQIAGSQRRLRVPARDVSICRDQPAGTSILNILPVTIVDMRDTGKAHCLLRLKLQEQHMLARITRRSRDELRLTTGDAVYAQIKSTALLGDTST